jgi:hypothetical protein
MADIQMVTNLCAGAIHRTDSTAKVTTGAWALTAETDANPVAKRVPLAERIAAMSAQEKERIENAWEAHYHFREPAAQIIAHYEATANYNWYRDDRLIQAGLDSLGTLDFYTAHYYDNGMPRFVCPFVNPCSTYGLTKPLVMAEFAPVTTLGLPYTDLYDALLSGGYAGGMSWSLNQAGLTGVDNGLITANALASLGLMFAGHPQEIDADPVPGNVYAYSAVPTEIDSGETSTLSWKTALGTSATLNGTPVSTIGTLAVTPPVTTTYTLVATGTIVDTLRRTVEVYRSGHIIAFTGTPDTLTPGEPFLLKWLTAHNSQVRLNGNAVARVDSMIVHPDSSQSYTLITGGAERDTLAVRATVVPVNQLNRALGKAVSASGTSTTPGFTDRGALVDGNVNSQWASAASGRQWVLIDLGQQFQLARVVIRWGDNYATAYSLQTSTDRGSWPTVRTISSGAGGTEILDSLAVTGRYVQLTVTSRLNQALGFAVRELEAYGVPQSPTSVSPATPQAVPDRFVLMQNYPNPFNPSTTIRFGLPSRARVQLTVYTALGQRVGDLVDGDMEPGYHAVQFNAAGLATGVYFYRLRAGSFVQTQKFLLVR